MPALKVVAFLAVGVIAIGVKPVIAAEKPSLSRHPTVPSAGSQMKAPANEQADLPSISVQMLLDQMYDYDVYVAEPVSGTEWVVEVRFAGESGWELLGNISYSPSTETAHFNGVRKFQSKSKAQHEAEEMLELGIIDDYFVYQRPKVPHWTYVGTYDDRQAAEDAANLLRVFGNLLVKIESILVHPSPIVRLPLVTGTSPIWVAGE